IPPPVVIDAVPEPPTPTIIQPLPGEVLAEVERPEPVSANLAGVPPSSAPGHDDYDRRGGRGRRDRDRRPKKPKIPSFETKSYEREVRPDDRSYSSSIEVLPGESLAKLSRRPGLEPEPGPELEDKNAP